MRYLPFPASKEERRLDLERSRALIRSSREGEIRRMRTDMTPHSVYDSTAFGREGILKEFVDSAVIQRSEIDEFFQGKPRNIVELGGPASRFSRNMRRLYPGQIADTVGITLVDFHLPQPRMHHVIEGDLSIPRGQERSPYDEVIKIVGKNNVDLIVSRMRGGFSTIPVNPYLFTNIVADMFQNMLSPTGMMLSELPSFMEPFMPEWMAMVKNDPGIETRLVYKGYECFLMIKRKDKNSTTLPLLGIQQLRNVYHSIKNNTYQNELINNFSRQV